MKTKALLSAITSSALIFGLSSMAQAAPTNLTVGSGGVGTLTVGVDAYGNFGSETLAGRDIGPATLVGSPKTENTTNSSYTAIRFANPTNGLNPEAGQLSNAAQYIGSGFAPTESNGFFPGLTSFSPTPGAPAPNPSATSYDTTFSDAVKLPGLEIRLIQTLDQFPSDPADPGTKDGTFFQQDYLVTNTSGTSITGELLRYARFLLNFNSLNTNVGGGRIDRNGQDYLYNTSSLVGENSETTYVVIGAEILDPSDPINENPTNNRFEFGLFNPTNTHSLVGGTTAADFLSDQILNDGDNNGITDVVSDYGLALRNSFTVAAGQTITYRTSTYWGLGTIANFDPPNNPNGGGGNPAPIPGTLALFGLAFSGLAGFRRKRKL